MTTRLASLAAVGREWSKRESNALDEYPIQALILVGSETRADRTAASYLGRYAPMLDDMTGAYCALTAVYKVSGGRELATDRLESFVRLKPSDIDAKTVYALAHALRIDLDELPCLVVSSDPLSSDAVLLYSMRAVLEEKDKHRSLDELTQFFRAFSSACRDVAPLPATKRLRAIEKSLASRQATQGLLARFSKTGVLAQVVEGVVSGLS